jgi:putative ubiquitin-RnfH superfamily antitoxin RatB of RatAB toxin-antitoxin module
VAESLAAYIADRTMRVLNSKDVMDAVRVSRLRKDKDKVDVDHIVGILSRQR